MTEPAETEEIAGAAPILVEVRRGGQVESLHRGAVVVADANGRVAASWGDPDRVIFPRSSCKMLQALALVESGAADRFKLDSERLALACASHNGAAIHTRRVARWLAEVDRSEDDLRCGPQTPDDRDARSALREAGAAPGQIHNNCSGKHTGFLTLSRHLGADGDPDYVRVDHPVQLAVRETLSAMTDDPDLGWAVDGCSAPNFATTLTGLATAMARMGAPRALGPTREDAARRLVAAMIAHPDLVAGEGRACTRLMRAMDGVVVKTGAEGVFTAILPGRALGIALKIDDGATRAAECAVAALLVALGAADRSHPDVAALLEAPVLNRRGLAVGEVRPAEAFAAEARAALD